MRVLVAGASGLVGREALAVVGLAAIDLRPETPIPAWQRPPFTAAARSLLKRASSSEKRRRPRG